MRIAIVRTLASPCRCAESVSEGLEALGHEFLVVDSEEIEFRASILARECDLVIDHTDTFRGRGCYRPLVRVLLEDSGARIVGSDARSCFLADNKAAAKARLAEAGIPVPPGISVQSNEFEIPGWLKPPLVLKPAFEHMSRSIRVVDTIQEAYLAAAQLLESLRQPILVESFIPGRELAVSLLAGPEGVQVLPILEWAIGSGRTDVLTEEFKLMEPSDEKHRVLKAGLSKDLNDELEALAQQAFHVLGLRDYARFDVRLSSNGTPFFLEANTTPSLEPMEALATSAHWAGLEYSALVDRILSAASSRYASNQPARPEVCRILLPTGPIELEIPEGVHRPPDSTVELAGLLDVQPGETVLELGCGTGLLSIAAAKLGAAQVLATDMDPRALAIIVKNAIRNGVADRIDIRAGSWYEALREGTASAEQPGRFDVIIATPPQTPGPRPFGPKYGGPDGTRNLLKVLEGIRSFLEPGRGRLWLMAISLANPPEIWKRLQELFADVALVRQTERDFTIEEYELIAKGLFDHFGSLRASGISEFTELGKGRYAFRNLFIRATGLRKS
jgi:D-alanine-D-alanine ligase-like ATP-grasp enzyme/methylase of polypeptide subunit release factors